MLPLSHDYLLAHGGFDYRCLHFIGPEMMPSPADNASTTATASTKLHSLAFDENASPNRTVLHGERVRGIGFSNDTVQEAVAIFFLVQKDHFYLGSLARSNMSSVMVKNRFGRDYGHPIGPAARTTGGVWERE